MVRKRKGKGRRGGWPWREEGREKESDDNKDQRRRGGMTRKRGRMEGRK